MSGTFDDSGIPSVHGDVSHSPQLVLVLECDRPLTGGARYSLDGVELITVGRGETRIGIRHGEPSSRTLDVRLPGRSVSGAHARLVRVGTSWAIEDLGSKNGTFVCNRRVESAVLAQDDFFEVGHTVFRLDPSSPTPSGAQWFADFETVGGDATATLDPSLAAQFDALAKVATSDVPVLLLGETGTGKELIARWVHEKAGRTGEFVAVNCGALPPELVESSLFGHIKGAFSGAVTDSRGFVRAAAGGTLFLDEVADLPKASQATLLRILQEREVVPVGASRPIPVDVRVVAATHQPLADMAARGDFRQDLFARIAGFSVNLPPLRERRDDFGILVAKLLRKIAGERAAAISLAPEVGRALVSYDWPMNIRELEQCLAACVALAPPGRIEGTHLPVRVMGALDMPQKEPWSHLTERDMRLRLELLGQLARHGGNLADVARSMGKARMQVHRWCKRFGVDPNVFRR